MRKIIVFLLLIIVFFFVAQIKTKAVAPGCDQCEGVHACNTWSTCYLVGNACVKSRYCYCADNAECSEFTGCNSCCTPQDGGWSGWSACSVSCGGGTQKRSCTDPAPSCGGDGCSGSSKKNCNTQACPTATPKPPTKTPTPKTTATPIPTTTPVLPTPTGFAGGSCTNFSDDFSAATLNTNLWELLTNNNGTISFPSGEAKFNLPSLSSPTSNMIVTLASKNRTIAGDFSAELLLKSVNTKDNKKSSSLEFSFDSPDSSKIAIRVSRYANSDDIPSNTIRIFTTGVAADYKNIGLTNDTPVKVKLERVGNKGSVYYDLLDGAGYKLAKTFDNVYTGEGFLQVFSLNFLPDYPEVTSVFDDFKLTCLNNNPIPTPTPVPGCLCSANGVCATVCSFDKFATPVTYTDPIKCNLSDSLFATAPSTVNKTSWCQVTKRTKGDADGNGIINNADYFYYVAAVNGSKIPVTVNPDFNGDGEVGATDRIIVIKTLNP